MVLYIADVLRDVYNYLNDEEQYYATQSAFSGTNAREATKGDGRTFRDWKGSHCRHISCRRVLSNMIPPEFLPFLSSGYYCRDAIIVE